MPILLFKESEKNPRVIQKVLVLDTVKKSINLGTTNPSGIDLSLKIRSYDVIDPMHCLSSLKIMVE